MQRRDIASSANILGRTCGFLRKCLFSVLSFGPMPKHIAFIMDGNRRFAKRRNMKGGGHRAGFSALICILCYCYEMGVKYVTVYAFSIDNFKRESDEVESVMDLMQEKIKELLGETSIVNKYGVKINFWGNLSLLSEPARLSAEMAMERTSGNTGPVLSVCLAYTSTFEITHALEKSCLGKGHVMQGKEHEGADNGDSFSACDFEGLISVHQLEEHLYTGDCPDPDILIRTSGETRLSNFLLWQTTFTHLQNPTALWPEFSLRHLVLSILKYQKVYSYLKARELGHRQ